MKSEPPSQVNHFAQIFTSSHFNSEVEKEHSDLRWALVSAQKPVADSTYQCIPWIQQFLIRYT